MRSCLLLGTLLPLLPTGVHAKALNAGVLNSVNTSTLAIGNPICIDPLGAREEHLHRVNYLDCIPILSEILLEPNTDRRNQYDTTTYYPGRLFRTCRIALLTSSTEGTESFWGYQIAIAAATAIKTCIEDSGDQYGGLVFATSRRLFYAQVKNLRDDTTIEANSSALSLESGLFKGSRLPNSINSTLLIPNPTSATLACQVSQLDHEQLAPVLFYDCYYLFYIILTNPRIVHNIVLRGLSPIRYEQYGTCTVQVRGHSALSADAFKYVQVLLGAVDIVKTCVVDSGLVSGERSV